MGGRAVGFGRVKRCYKQFSCYWCGEVIKKASSYVRWTWIEGKDAERIRCHPECYGAWCEDPDCEPMQGEHERPKDVEIQQT